MSLLQVSPQVPVIDGVLETLDVGQGLIEGLGEVGIGLKVESA